MRHFVTILMPALNEEAHIETAISSLLASATPDVLELIVLDGGSTDKTEKLVLAMAERDSRIKWVDNPERLQAAAINLGAKLADPRSTILVRADCHADYPKHFIAHCTAPLIEEKAESVVVPMHTHGRHTWQRAIAYAQNSLLGNGGAKHRRRPTSHYVDHGHHAAYLRSAFLAIGGYNQTMAANEDAEFDFRFHKAGFRIWLESAAMITYFPRPTLKSLARQYFRYGIGRATTCLMHRIWPKPRQILPAIIVVVCLIAFALSFWQENFLIIPLSYAALCHAFALPMLMRRRDPSALLSGLAAMVMHVSWGTGFLKQIIAHSTLRKCTRAGTSSNR